MALVGVPPFTLDHWDNVFHSGMDIDMTPSMDPFRRFEWGVPAKSYCSYAFILHMLKCLDEQNGRMAVVVPQGVLYRVGSEQVIRQRIIEANFLDAVIALPPRLYGENTPSLCLMVFKKNRSNTDILFIDASSEMFYEKGKKQNLLRSNDVISIFKNRDTEDGVSIKASAQDIAGHDYALRVSKYIDTDDEDTEMDISAISKELSAIEANLVVAHSRVVEYLDELGLRDEK
ncbi:MAG: N-6 DNA methylase [Oscillospiraceae bacterium]|nr:N-6 DNA methylase [Oscillospiraceae bacterium]